jgi:hypothetical protein
VKTSLAVHCTIQRGDACRVRSLTASLEGERALPHVTLVVPQPDHDTTPSTPALVPPPLPAFLLQSRERELVSKLLSDLHPDVSCVSLGFITWTCGLVMATLVWVAGRLFYKATCGQRWSANLAISEMFTVQWARQQALLQLNIFLGLG